MDCFKPNFITGISEIYISAEIGINHNGDLNVAKELINNSKKAGVNAVKFQKRTIDIVYSEDMLSQTRCIGSLSGKSKTEYVEETLSSWT